ncbi:Uncharacterised protein [Yersinia mollaretii]|uniref:Uncharacterized protein n=1 Tax=Yersinia mollaretii TaxID=33060 RepID=A0AA36LI88_YERMO|nr:Uncharacterised protein [Yersinia mollaretii]CNH32419.1 Uncharacterised protein [Yersinia mollaretii]CQJ14325.1 Uncharacterised protein [Yersinia mollaretii]
MLLCTITEHTENQDIDIVAMTDSVRKKKDAVLDLSDSENICYRYFTN